VALAANSAVTERDLPGSAPAAGCDQGRRGLSPAVAAESWAAELEPARLRDRKLTEWTARYQRKMMAMDGLCALAAGLLAYVSRMRYLSSPDLYLAATCLLPVGWVAVVALTDGYDSRLIGIGSDEFRRVLNAGLTLTAAIAIASYAAKAELARGYVLVAFPTLTMADLVARHLLRKWLHRRRAQGAFMQRVVVVGYPDVVADMARQLRREAYHGLTVVAACLAGPHSAGSPTGERLAHQIGGIPAVDGLDRVGEVSAAFAADTVAVLSCPELSGTRLRELAWELEKSGTSLCVAPAVLDIAGPRTSIRPAAGLPLVYMDHPEFTGIPRVLKAAFDRAVAAGALILLAPLLAAIAVAIKCDDRGPVLFSQVRVGVDGARFRIYKFRTMVRDAEALKAKLAARNETGGVLFKIRDDPRITAVGGWLRRWSLDELPQLINVLRGDMSLVGPRPALPQEAAQYPRHAYRRLAVKPGITGLWQVSGRSDLPWEEAVRLDLRYVENWSFMLDLQILWKTWSAIGTGAGAY
jgi:exopolysaccharide biosynthesis polyprenyl glycosylphosphotransferase